MTLRSSILVRQCAMTIAEVIIATAVFSVAMTALLAASISMQTSFAAVDDYFTNQGDQARVLDYFTTDLRRCMAYALNTNSVVYNGTTYSNTVPTGATKYMTVVIPNYRDATTTPSTVRFPTITSDTVSYGTSPIKISYYLLGTSLYRIEVNPDLSSGDSRNNATSIADNVSDFNITDSTVTNPLITETVVSISATFAPKFNRAEWTSSLSTGSTTSSRTGTTVGCKIQLRNIFD